MVEKIAGNAFNDGNNLVSDYCSVIRPAVGLRPVDHDRGPARRRAMAGAVPKTRGGGGRCEPFTEEVRALHPEVVGKTGMFKCEPEMQTPRHLSSEGP